MTGGRAQLDTKDIDFDFYKTARELMESSGMIMLPQQEVQAGGVHLWQLRRQATSASNGFAIREFQCPMRHLCKCNVGLRIVEGPRFMQLERLGMHDRQSNVAPPRRALMEANVPPEPDDSDDDEEAEEDEDSEDSSKICTQKRGSQAHARRGKRLEESTGKVPATRWNMHIYNMQ